MLVDIFVFSFLSLVSLLTVLREVKLLEEKFYFFPTFMQFVPTWSFFAPIPNMCDYHLLLRGKMKDGYIQDWQKTYQMKDKRPWYAFLWNPEKRYLKGMLDIALDLLKFSNMVNDKNQIIVSLPYLQLLNYLDQFRLDDNTESIQFMIFTDSKLQKPNIVFISAFHPLTRNK